MKPIIDYLFQNPLLTLLLGSGLIQIAPIKWNPITALFKWLSKSLTGDLNDSVKALDRKLDKHIEKEDEEKAKITRMRILSFDSDLRNGGKFQQELWDATLEDIDTYERYCLEHPNYLNSKAKASIAHIKAEYSDVLKNNYFA